MFPSSGVTEQEVNWSAHTDTQQQVAAARQLLRSGGLRRYLS